MSKKFGFLKSGLMGSSTLPMGTGSAMSGAAFNPFPAHHHHHAADGSCCGHDHARDHHHHDADCGHDHAHDEHCGHKHK